MPGTDPPDPYSRMIPAAAERFLPEGSGNGTAVERELAPQRLPVRREDPAVVRGLVHHEDHDPGTRIIACLQRDPAGDRLGVVELRLTLDRRRPCPVGDAPIPRAEVHLDRERDFPAHPKRRSEQRLEPRQQGSWAASRIGSPVG